MVPLVGAYSAVKGVLQGWKFWLMVAVWGVTALWFYQEGKQSCQESAYKALEKELTAQEKRAAQAVKQAVEDAQRASAVKEKGNEIKERANQITSDDACVVPPERMSVLAEVQRQTERK